MAKESAFFRGTGGYIFKMDLPLSENYQDQLDKGTLHRITGHVVEVQGGEGEGVHYRLAEAPAEAEEPLDPETIPAGSIEKVMEWVGEDRDRATRALAAEQAKGDKARGSLVKTLSDLLAA